MGKGNPLVAFIGLIFMFLLVLLINTDWSRNQIQGIKSNYVKYKCLEQHDKYACEDLLNRVELLSYQVKFTEVIRAKEILCEEGKFNACVNVAKELMKKGSMDIERAKRNLNLGCREGYGGSMKACGILGNLLLEAGNKTKGREFRKMACKVTLKEFCD